MSEFVNLLKRATIGVDGDHAFASLGEDIQAGEAEFVLIDHTANDEPDRHHNPGWVAAAERAANEALSTLRIRLGTLDRNDRETWITYALDPSHPRYCP